MRYRPFEPLGRALSVLVLGTAYFLEEEQAAAFELLDAWVEAGGNILDTAREYGAWGQSETVIGRWLAEREPEGLAILTKGGHHKEGRRRVTPEDVGDDLTRSLDALGVDTVDVYLLHRDDPSKPVGPMIEVLNEHLAAGRIRTFGASNWTPGRFEEANRYAAERGLAGFSCASPGLSLAEQQKPPWPDCVSAHDPASLGWYERTQTPAFAWSSQAAGFFAGREDAEIERVYGGERNRERLRRARELAGVKGYTPNQVALAWVLHQPFPTFAIIGPATVAELRDSLAALEVELTPAEVRRLDLEEEE